MNTKVITIWGANGSGKTTVAVNLGAAIADNCYMVGVISSKLSYGELQGLFGKRVENAKGIYQAVSNGCNTKNMFEATSNPNLFFLSVPNGFDAMLLTAISGETVTELIEDAAMRFDYIIIDGCEDLNNPISSIGLTMSETIIAVHRVSAKGCLWQSSMKNTINLLHLESKIMNVMNGYDKTCDKLAYINGTGLKFDFELPYITNAKILENSGKLIYDSKIGTGAYKKTISRLASQVTLGG